MGGEGLVGKGAETGDNRSMARKLLIVGLLAVGGLVAAAQRPGQMAVQGDSSALAEPCQETAEWLGRQLGPGGAVVVRPPFVLGGDLPGMELERWHREVIGPASQAMGERYFKSSPDRPIVAILMSSEASYCGVARRVFGDSDVSTHGYYKPHLRALVVNVSRGSASVLHELTHALASFDFPAAPAWISEGLAALHEDCDIVQNPPGLQPRAGGRLEVLREALDANRLGPLSELLARPNLHGPDEALLYAHARLFCLWLERRGLLCDVWAGVREAQSDDPSGHATVARLTGDGAGRRLEADFRQFLRTLAPD